MSIEEPPRKKMHIEKPTEQQRHNGRLLMEALKLCKLINAPDAFSASAQAVVALAKHNADFTELIRARIYLCVDKARYNIGAWEFRALHGELVTFFTDVRSSTDQFSELQIKQLDAWILDAQEFSAQVVEHGVDVPKPDPIVLERPSEPPQRLRRAEAILRKRTDRFILVLEKCYDPHNISAILRTAECFGIQNVWVVAPVELKKKRIKGKSAEESTEFFNRKISKGMHDWLSIRRFATTAECIRALRDDERTIWATDLCKTALCLDTAEGSSLVVPDRLAVVMGREADGVSQEMLDESDQRIFLPMCGFSDSFNLSVASALILQHLFFHCPEARGQMQEEDRSKLRHAWYSKLAKTPQMLELFLSYVENPPEPLDDVRRPNKCVTIPPKIRKRIDAQEKSIKEQQ